MVQEITACRWHINEFCYLISLSVTTSPALGSIFTGCPDSALAANVLQRSDPKGAMGAFRHGSHRREKGSPKILRPKFSGELALPRPGMAKVATPESAFAAANAHFVDERYDEALKEYNTAIELEDANADYYLKRSACHLKLKNFEGEPLDFFPALVDWR